MLCAAARPSHPSSTTTTEHVKEARLVPTSVPVADWFRETTIGNRTTTEHLYTVNATVFRVKNSAKIINLVKQALEHSDMQPGDQVALYSRRRGRLIARAEVAALDSGARVVDIDARMKPSAVRTTLREKSPKVVFIERQSDLDRLLKILGREEAPSIRKIIALGENFTVPRDKADLVTAIPVEAKRNRIKPLNLQDQTKEPEQKERIVLRKPVLDKEFNEARLPSVDRLKMRSVIEQASRTIGLLADELKEAKPTARQVPSIKSPLGPAVHDHLVVRPGATELIEQAEIIVAHHISADEAPRIPMAIEHSPEHALEHDQERPDVVPSGVLLKIGQSERGLT